MGQRVYNERWNYSWGSETPGNVDNLELIFSYVGTGLRTIEDMLSSSNNSGDISTIPDIPGLGVYTKGHVGVYVGNGLKFPE